MTRAPAAERPLAAPAAPGAGRRRRRRSLQRAALPALAALLGGVVLLNVAVGAVPIPPGRVVAILADTAGLPAGAVDAQQASILLSIRLPRTVVGLLVGAALGLAGAALQGIFRNPLADPSVIGTSSGAAVGAVAAIVLTPASVGVVAVPVAAFAGGLAAAALVYVTARHAGRTEVVTLVLTGIAVNALGFACVGLAQHVADDDQLRSIVFWLLGSLAGSLWRDAAATAPLIALGLVLVPRWWRTLDLLALGEREARHLGADPERARTVLVTLTALLTGAAVSVAGIIGFVGLVVPHLLRLAVGPGHRVLLPASALGGAILLLAADLVARTVAAPAELPLGVVTAFLGAPCFLSLLRRTRAAQGGWA
jgi:iron complex transport system permease protein